MKLARVPGMVVTATALALVAGCTGGGDAPPPVEPVPSAGAIPSSASESPPTSAPGPTAAAGSKPAASGPSVAGAVEQVGRPAGTRRPAPGKPVISRVWTTPALSCDPACTLSPPVGTVTFHAAVTGATSVEFFLVPTGTDTAPYRRSIGLDRNGADGWTARYPYADEPLWAHLTVLARGPGGTADALPFNIHHPEPLGPTIGAVWTEPSLPCRDVWCTLPPGAGTVRIHAEVRDALGVAFFLDPVDGGPSIPLGSGVRRGGSWSVTWSYADVPLQVRVRVSAGNNLGHRSVAALGLAHS